MKTKEKFRQFMMGRYGNDQLGKFILFLVIICCGINIFLKKTWLATTAIILLIYFYYRAFSKDVNARYAENKKYLDAVDPLRKKFFKSKNKYQNRKVYKYIKCPNCKFEMKVPKGKGKIRVTCKSCGKKFEIKS